MNIKRKKEEKIIFNWSGPNGEKNVGRLLFLSLSI